MNNKILLLSLFTILIISLQINAKPVYRFNYFKSDLNYQSYRVESIVINGNETQPNETDRLTVVIQEFQDELIRNGLIYSETPDLIVNLKLKIDTLNISSSSEESYELAVNYTIEIIETGTSEKVFSGTIDGLIITGGKRKSKLKKIYKKFFKQFGKMN